MVLVALAQQQVVVVLFLEERVPSLLVEFPISLLMVVAAVAVIIRLLLLLEVLIREELRVVPILRLRQLHILELMQHRILTMHRYLETKVVRVILQAPVTPAAEVAVALIV